MDTPGDIGPTLLDEDGQDSEPPQRLSLEVAIEDGDWAGAGDLEALVADVAEVVSRSTVIGAMLDPASACVAFTSDAAVRALNARFRAKDKPTNVLSFPAPPPPAGAFPEGDGVALGDIVLAAETVAAEARELGIPIDHHVRHLVVHGVLHLLGHDHEADAEAEIMEGLETKLLAELGVPDPYRSNE